MTNDNTISEFDRLVGALEGLPDVVKSSASTVRAMLPLIGIARSFIVQTYRQKDRGDTIFIETVGHGETIRLAIPPQVSDAIARQRDSLGTKSRKKAARAVMAERIARGETPHQHLLDPKVRKKAEEARARGRAAAKKRLGVTK
jgi:CRISPR/Cas system-associated protein Csm6